MKEIGKYDSALQMFVEQPKPIDMGRLRFLRWMVEQGRVGRVMGVSSGDLVPKPVAVGPKSDFEQTQ